MKIVKALFVLMLLLSLIGGMPSTSRAEVMLTAIVTGIGFDMMPSAMFSLDDWYSTDNMWSITVFNTTEGNKKVTRLILGYSLSNPSYGTIVQGEIRIVGAVAGKYFKEFLLPGESYTINNKMFRDDTPQVTTQGSFEDRFMDEALRIGYLPEGTYEFAFWIESQRSWYEDPDDKIESASITEVIDIKTPEPPELVTPDQNADDVPVIPRFNWQAPLVTDFTQIKSVQRSLNIFYTFRLYKMFETDGTVLDQETAIVRIPIWEVSGWTDTSIDFDPGASREELISGRSYCWQVQAFDATGRVISQTNEGKSDVWQFTIQFTPLVVNEPIMFYPLRFSWTPAQTGGGLVLYDLFVADNFDFTNAYIERGMVTTSFTYPGNARILEFGIGYYVKIQATDDSGLPLGEPVIESIILPSLEATPTSPPDGETLATKSPTFRWQGEAEFHVVTIIVADGEWSYMSGGIEGNSWTYDGEEFAPGVSYSWTVTPSNDLGDPLGVPSDSWTFSLPAAEQMTLISPVNERIETVFPDFSWNSHAAATGDNVVYRIIITDENGSTIHSADVPQTSYTYPSDGTALEYGKRYTWTVGALVGGSEIGQRSEPVWFVTPFVETTGDELTMTEMEEAIKLILGDYPEAEKFSKMILASITGPEGSLTPGQLMELLDTYKIINVTAK